MCPAKTSWGSIPMHAKGDELIARAKDYIGTRWKHQGRSEPGGSGIDCAGLCIRVAQELGVSTFETRNYSKRANPREFRRAMFEWGCTTVLEPGNGDLLRMASDTQTVHIGFYERDTRGVEWIIHSLAPARKVVREEITREMWRDVIREIMRLPE